MSGFNDSLTANDDIWPGALDNSGNDRIFGLGGNDTLNGGAGDDTLVGGNGNDLIIRGNVAGNNSLSGGTEAGTIDILDYSAVTANISASFTGATLAGLGNDTLSSFESYLFGSGNDTIRSGTGAETIDGGAGDDTLDGRSGNDLLIGGEGNDSLLGVTGDDTLDGGIGNDSISRGAQSGNNSLVGGTGNDILDFVASTANAITVDISTPNQGRATVAGLGNDSLSGFENYQLGGGKDSFLGSANAETISGRNGDDTLVGNGGNDVFFGASGNDCLSAGDDNSNGTLFGAAGDDTLIGGPGQNLLSPGEGNDSIFGVGVDTARGTDLDTLNFQLSGAAAALSLNLQAGTDAGGVFGTASGDGSGGVDTIRGNLIITGSFGNDTMILADTTFFVSGQTGDDSIIGGNGKMRMAGSAGNDTIVGRDGEDNLVGDEDNDSLVGGNGGDILRGEIGDDTLNGGNGADVLNGGNGDDVLNGGNGADLLEGGNGTDWASYANAGGAVTVDLGASTSSGADGNDRLTGIENVLGGNGNDSILGDSLANVLDGGNGDDTLQGGLGDDILDGGNGNDFVSYADAASGVDVGLSVDGGGNPGGGAVGDALFNFEGVIGSDFNDTLVGNASDNTLIGGDGVDSLIGGDGNDRLDFGDGDESFSYKVTDNFGNETLIGGEGQDTLDLGVGWRSGPEATGFINYQRADGTIIFTQGWETVVCFAEGTRIVTPNGEDAVENLRAGDMVLAMRDGQAGFEPLRWVGFMDVAVPRNAAMAAKTAPVLIKAGALGAGMPARDLRVSPDHAMELDGHLIPAKHLINGSSIIQETWCRRVRYFHLELEAHGLLLSEGTWSESYLDDGNRHAFNNAAMTGLFLDFEAGRSIGQYDHQACLPVLRQGLKLDEIHGRIALRAEAMVVRRKQA